MVAGLLVPSPVWSQLPAVGVPGGVVRVELDGALETFDRRFRDGHREGFGADLSSPALGSDRIPSLADADARIGRVIGNPNYRINLGSLATDAQADVGTGYFGLSLGLTNHITVFGRIPLVRARVQSARVFNASSADAGLSPDQANQIPFFNEFDAALTTLNNKIAAGDYDANPTQKALAQATLADATLLRSDLFGLLSDPATAAPTLPVVTSTAGTAIDGRIAALQNTLTSSLNIPGFVLTPALPATPLTRDELLQLLGSSTFDLRLGESKVTFRGDAEVGLSLTLVDQWDRSRRRGGFRAAVSGLARLPTGRRDREDHPLDLGTGDGQTDVQVELVTDVGAGPLGARLTGSYVRQLPANILVRVTAPSQPLVGPNRLALVRSNPGDIVSIGVHPFVRLARTLAVQAGVDHWIRSTDQVSYASPANALPGIDPSILAAESKANATQLSVGITYANPGSRWPGGRGLPVDATWSYERVLRQGGLGRVPDTHRIAARFRTYFGVW